MSLKDAAKHIASRGRGPDSMLVHMAPSEVAGLQRLALAAGGSLSIHPETGLPEAGFLKNLLPTIIGAGLAATGVGLPAAMAAGALTGAATNKQNPLMGAISGGLGAYGGAGLAEGLGVAGGAAATPAANAPAVVGGAGTPISAQAGQEMAASLTNAGYGGATAPVATPWSAMPSAARQEAIGRGVQSLTEPGGWGNFVGQAADKTTGTAASGMGGTSGLMTKAGMAAAPALMATPEQPKKPDYGSLPEYTFDWNDIYKPGGGFTPKYADGGQLSAGGFVVPADVVSALGNGSSSAGLEVLASKFGAKAIDGPGDGMSDSIPTSIDGKQKARVARDEAYIPPEQVRAAGGAKKLYAMMDRIRAQAHGKTTQQRKINPNKAV